MNDSFSSPSFYVTTFYRFLPMTEVLKHHGFESLELIKEALLRKANELDLQGLLILGMEGINSTSAAPSPQALKLYKQFLCDFFQVEELNFKDSESNVSPFRRFTVKIRDEIVTLGTPGLVPETMPLNHHLSPSEWNQVMKNEEDVVLIDTRNWYETKIGTFRGAINPDIDKFTDFPAFLESQNISKDQKMLIFCTGGIRCEKGIFELQRQGYENVYQLEGGILKYLEEYPNDQFEGECFVFDRRVAVDQKLKPTTQYGLCPHCGQPADTKIQCQRCDTETLICEECVGLEWKKVTCSKNCAYQFELHPDRKALPQRPLRKSLKFRGAPESLSGNENLG